jgi:hypothetical protein
MTLFSWPKTRSTIYITLCMTEKIKEDIEYPLPSYLYTAKFKRNILRE